MDNREYYTLIELIIILRREFIKAYGILNQMKECLNIDENISKDNNKNVSKFDYDFRLCLKSYAQYICDGNKKASIVLDVNRRSPLASIRRGIINIRNGISPGFDSLYELDHGSYSMDLDGETNYLFDYNLYNNHFVTEISVLDEKKEYFNELYHQLQELDICNTVRLTGVNSIEASNSHIEVNSLGIIFNYAYNTLILKYDAQSDQLSYKTKYRTKNHPELKKILLTRIPVNEIPDMYLDILKKYDFNIDNLSLDNYFGRKGAIALSNEDSDKLVLTKVKKH